MSKSSWSRVQLGDLFRINGSQIFPAQYNSEEFIHYSIPALDEKGGPVIELGAVIESHKTYITKPSVLVSKLNPRKPRIAVVNDIVEYRYCCSTEFICYQPKSKNEHLGYWGLYFASSDFVKRLERVAIGSTNSHTRANPKETLEWFVPNPSIVEKIAISQVAYELDTTIRQTEAIIAKLQQVKQGLLHDLLTRGIDANGQLRPPAERAPYLYKESSLGWIPREWEVNSIGQLLADVDPAMRSGPFGSALLKSELVETGIPLLGIDNVHIDQFDQNFVRFVSLKKFRELARYAVRPQDLMITIMGTVGRCCLVPDDIGNALSSKHTWVITLNQNKYLPYLAMLQVNYAPWVLRHFARDEQGGIMSAIRSETLRSALLPVPPIREQKMIEECIQNSAHRIDIETTYVAKLKNQKSALMDDLLTGRVRVTALLSGETPVPEKPERESA